MLMMDTNSQQWTPAFIQFSLYPVLNKLKVQKK